MSVSTPRRVDASMTLLTEMMQRPLDPGYQAAAERRRQSGADPVTPVSRAVTMVLLTVVGLLTVTAVLSLRTPQPEAATAKDALLQRIKTETTAADRLQHANDALRLANDQAQAALLRVQAKGGLADQLQQLGMVSGALPVRGPGLRVTLNDAPGSAPSAGEDPRQQDQKAQGRVLDRDLQIVVNGLWGAGAEAVSINGQRLTALSAIRSAGQAILVDFRPLTPPYVIEAVGAPDALRSGFAAGTGGAYLHSLQDNYAISSSIESVSAMSLPASSGLTLHEVRPPAQRSSSSPSHSSGSTP